MEKEIEDFKQLLDIILDEANVKVFGFPVGDTEKGKLFITYQRTDRKFRYKLGDNYLPKVPTERVILETYKAWKK